MPGGTFTLTGTIANSGADSGIPSGAATLNQCVAINGDFKFIIFNGGAGTSYVVRSDPTSNVWVLVGDAGGTYSFATLPSGFVPLTAQLNYGGGGSGATNFYGGTDAFVNANATANVEFDVGTVQTLNRLALNVNPASPFVDTRFPGGSALDLNNNGYGFRFSCTGAGVSFELDVLTITGTYEVQLFSWTIDTPSPVLPGDTVQISSSGIDALDFTHLTLSLQYNGGPIVVPITGPNIITQTNNLFIFTIPNVFGSFEGTIDLVATGDGTQFSGDMSLGTMQILLADSSGLYTLVLNKAYDTIYISTHNIDNTKNVKIPDPFIKTGPYGG